MTDQLRRESNNSCSPRDICCIYRTEAEQQAALQVFVTSAATCSARVALTGAIALAAALLVDQPRPAHRIHQPWVQDGLACCTPADLSALLAMARVAGYRALWLAVDGAPAELVTAAVGLGITVLNLYDASRLPGSALLEALRRHPFILAAGEISENEHHCPPVQTADPYQDARFAACYQRLLARRSAARASLASDQDLAVAARLDQDHTQLRSQQPQLDLLLQQAPVLIWTTDLELVVVSIVGGRRHISASILDELTGKPVTYLFEEEPPVLDAHHAALRGEDARYQLCYDGHDYLAWVEPLCDAAGLVEGVIGVALDVTEQLAVEEQLLLTQAFNRSLLDASQDQLLLLDSRGHILALNEPASRGLAQPAEALTGQLLSDQLSLEMGQALVNDLDSVTNTRQPVERTIEQGAQMLRLRLDPIIDPQSKVAQVAVLLQDISHFLRSEQSEQRRREMAEIMRSVCEDLTRSTHRPEVLKAVMEGVRRLAPELSVHVMSIQDGKAVMEACFQQPEIRALGDLSQLPPMQISQFSNLNSMFTTQKPFLIEDIWKWDDWIKLGPSDWMRSYAGVPIVMGGAVVGFITVASERPGVLNESHVELIQSLAGQAAVALQKVQVFADLEEKNAALARAYVQLAKSNQDLATAYDATIAGWARALELRDKETEGHSQRVVALTLRLVERMQVPRETHAYIRWGALLHDIGKMGIPDNILLKADQPLTDKEWVVMKLHPTLAYDMLSGIPYLGPALEIPYSHHEWWDGTGYPQGLKGSAIPLPARIFSVVDAWDALTNERPYRPAWSPWRVAKHIRALSGQQFDPQVVEEFLKMMNFE